MADYLAVGIDPRLTTICLQSALPALAELSALYMNIVTVARVERNPTVKNEIAQKGFARSLPVGFLAYPISRGRYHRVQGRTGAGGRRSATDD